MEAEKLWLETEDAKIYYTSRMISLRTAENLNNGVILKIFFKENMHFIPNCGFWGSGS